MKIKSGRYEYEITSKDILMDNGACIQVIGRVTLSCKGLTISKAVFTKLKKDDLLELIKEENKWVKGGIRYYKLKDD